MVLHIVALGWLWVTLMMAITEKSVVAGVMTFVFYGLIPCGITLYVLGGGARRRRRAREQLGPAKDGNANPAAAPGEDGDEAAPR